MFALLLVLLFGTAILTAAAELPVVLLLYRRRGCRLLIPGCILINLFTNLLLNTILIFCGLRGSVPAIVLGEILVFSAELAFYAVMYPQCGCRRAAVVSFSANSTSLLFGLLIGFFWR